MMDKNSFLKLVILQFSILVTQIVHAQDIPQIARPIVEISKLQERFDDAKVSADVLTGYRIGQFKPNSKIQPVLLELPRGSERDFCVALITNDGRFSAENRYRMASIVDGLSPVEITPITSKYREELLRYDSASFAVKAFQSTTDKCSINNATYLPQISQISFKNLNLQLLLNTETRSATVDVKQLLQSGNYKFSCEPIEGKSAIGFDTVCNIPLQAALERQTLNVTVSLNDGFSVERHNYNLFVPEIR